MGLARTALTVKRSVGGLFALEDMSVSTGSRIYVSSGTGTDAAGYGSGPDLPVATLDYAVGLCTANKGDIIYLMPGHAESLAAATSAAVDVAGISIVGLGHGSLIPTFTLITATTATIAVTAANVRIKNIKVISDLADVAAGITASNAADGLTIENCIFSDGAAAKELVIGVSLAAACDGCVIRDCLFTTVDGGGCASAIKLVGESVDTLIENCVIFGDYSSSGIDGGTAGATRLRILDNEVRNADATAGLAIKLHASTTGTVRGNLMLGGKDGTAPIAFAAAFCGQNYYSNAAGASAAILAPATDA